MVIQFKNSYLLPLLIGLSCTVFFQEKSDSTLKILAMQSEDSNKVNTLNNLSWEFYSSNSTLSLTYAQQALSLGKKLSYKIGMASAHNSIGIA